jgi:hypothetical protein
MHDIEMHLLSDGGRHSGGANLGLPTAVQARRTKAEHFEGDRPVAIRKLPGIVACTGGLVVASENSNPEAILTLKLRTESGDQVLLPLSERTTRQLQLVISE